MDLNKRRFLIFSIIIIKSLVKVATENEVFIVTEQECITNGSSAITFNDYISKVERRSDGRVNDINSYTFYPSPTIINNDIDCKIDVNEDCIKYWTNPVWSLRDSIMGEVDSLITDRRWEGFSLYKTKQVDTEKEPLEYQYVLRINLTDFEIAFSVRIEKEAHVYLCDNGHPHHSNCYWIMLDAFDGTKSALRQCTENYIEEVYGTWPKPPCTYKHAKYTYLILNKKFWRHFKVLKKDNSLIVRYGSSIILQYNTTNPISPRFLFFHSKRVDGLWKLHKFTYIYCKEKSYQQLGPQDMIIGRGKNCIAMFIVMCANCIMTIRIIKKDGNIELFRKDFTTVNEKWKEIKIIFTSDDQSFAGLYVETDSQKHLGIFWAIDDIRQCEENEYRVLQSQKSNLPCERVDNNSILNIDQEDVKDNPTLDISCPETSFGKFCVPCEIFGSSSCKRFKYCEQYEQYIECSCTAGYYKKGCYTDCPYGKYGHNCKRTCENCSGGCNVVNGICYGNTYQCLHDYKGAKCNIPPAPILKYKPQVINISPTSCIIKIESSELEEESVDTPTYLQVQYKTSSDSIWTTVDNIYHFEDIPLIIPIENLTSETEYHSRILLYSDHSNIYLGDKIKIMEFKTTCHSVTEDDLEIIPTNTTATINVKVNEESCKMSEYRYSVNGGGEQPAKKIIELKDLSPYYPYTFSLIDRSRQVRISKSFKTREGVPLEVENLIQIGNSTNEISLSWSEPRLKYGEVQNYIISYKRLGGRACFESENQPGDASMIEQSFERYVTLKNLKPYSRYVVQVSAVTVAGTGKISDIKAITAPSERLLKSEVPEITNYVTSADVVEITLDRISCNYMEGPIYISSNATCYNEWCVTPKNNTKNIYNPHSPSVVLTGLFPFTNYTLLMKFSRVLNWSNSIIIFINFTTEPTVLNSIKDIDVTSKDTKSISLRWTPPYPPTGKLDRYKIKYRMSGGRKFTEKDIYPQSCKIWSNYHCFTITANIFGESYFDIEIWGTNELPNHFDKLHKAIRVFTAENTPEAPYDIEGTWSHDDDLIISWKHPNVTNGVLQRFEIYLTKNNHTKTFALNIDGEKDYNLTYTVKIDKKELDPCTKYFVQVAAVNTFYGKYSEMTDISSPPPIPPNIPEETVKTYSTNQSITIEIPEMKYQQKNIENCDMKLYMLISNYSGSVNNNTDIEIFKNHLLKHNNLTFTNSRIVYENYQKNLPLTFQIGNSTFQLANINYINPPLQSGMEYTVYLFFVNEHNKSLRFNQMSKRVITTLHQISESTGSSNGKLYVLLLLLLFIPLIYLAYKYRHVQSKNSSKAFTNSSKSSSSQQIDSISLKEKQPSKAVSVVKPMIVAKPRTLRENLSPVKTEHSKPVNILAFESYVKESMENGELERQHGLFPRGQTKPWQYGSLKPNKSKNRYNNLIAYDHTRVKLNKLEGKEHSDYINANYIDGYRYPRAYIATQGPKVSTLNDFWRMIWQENVKNIVMLANIYENGKKKVEKYWPDINETKDFDGIKVQYESSVIFANYDNRVFTVSYNNEQRKIHQFHFTTWPDHGVPLYPESLVPFLQNILKIPYNSNSPVVIHCSAGVGRTGTIILCDICLRMVASGGTIDFLSNLEYLRSQRPNMVDNIEQYKLAHLVVLDCLCGMRTSIKCNEEMVKTVDDLINNDAIKLQMKYLKENEWQMKALDSNLEEQQIPIYPEKNRFQDILPDLQHRVFITRYPPSDEKSSYINAVQVDGFRSPGRFIVTQQPMPNTLGDFWRLVYERKSTVIISLNTINAKDKSSCQFWPINGGTLSPVDYIKITHTNTRLLNYYEIVTLRMQVTQNEEENITIEIVSMKNWKSSDLLPNSIEEFLTFWEESNAIARQSDPVIITCHNGARACGLYLAVSFLIEKMKLEQECDVCLAVQNIRHHRKQFVDSEGQFEFLYRACATYISGFQSYANFE